MYKTIMKSLKLFIEPLVYLKRFITDMKVALTNNPDECVNYAAWVLKDRFKLGESAIAKDPNTATLYAVKIIKGRFPLGEEEISKCPRASTKYAIEIIKGRFIEGEKSILSNDKCSREYLQFIIDILDNKSNLSIIKNS